MKIPAAGYRNTSLTTRGTGRRMITMAGGNMEPEREGIRYHTVRAYRRKGESKYAPTEDVLTQNDIRKGESA